MKPTSHGLRLKLPFVIPAYWTPEQAHAVFELLDDLRELIWNHYSLQLIDHCREQQKPLPIEPSDTTAKDPPF
jgi:hypothetical protein